MKNTDLNRLEGMILSSVSVQINSIRLIFIKYPFESSGNFKDSATIEVEHGYIASSLMSPVFAKNGLEKFRNCSCEIIHLIDKKVIGISTAHCGDAEILFDNMFKLKLLYGDDGFEGYSVNFMVTH